MSCKQVEAGSLIWSLTGRFFMIFVPNEEQSQFLSQILVAIQQNEKQNNVTLAIGGWSSSFIIPISFHGRECFTSMILTIVSCKPHNNYYAN